MPIKKGNSLWWKARLDNTKLKQDTAQTKGILKNFSNQVSSLDIFAGLSTAAGLAFVNMAKSAQQFSKDYETAMKEVQTISAAVQADYEGMADKVLELSREVPDDAITLSKALYQIVSAGYDGAAGMDLLATASKAAVAGVSDTITAADGLTTIMNAWGLEAIEANRVADIMFQTVKLGKTTFSEISANISLVASQASAFGISFEEVSAAIASLTKKGATTSQALTQIRSAMVSMSEALGDGWSKTMTFQEGLQAMRDMAGGSENELKRLAKRVEAMAGILALTDDNFEGAVKDLEDIKDAAGAATDAYNVMADSTTVKLKVFQNNINAIKKGLGDTINNILADTLGGEALERNVDVLVNKAIPAYAKFLGIVVPLMDALEFSPEGVRHKYYGDIEGEEIFEKWKKEQAQRKLSKEEYAKLIDKELEKIKAERTENYELYRDIEDWTDAKKRRNKENIEALGIEQRTLIKLQELYQELRKSYEVPVVPEPPDGGGEVKLITSKKLKEELEDAIEVIDNLYETVEAGESRMSTDAFRDYARSLKKEFDSLDKYNTKGNDTALKSKKAYLEQLLKKYEGHYDLVEVITREYYDVVKDLEEEALKNQTTRTDAEVKNLQRLSKLAKKTLAEMKKAVDKEVEEASKQLHTPTYGVSEDATFRENLGAAVPQLYNLSGAFQEAARFASVFDDELAESADSVSELISGVGQIAEGIVTKNAWATISGVFSTVTGLARLFEAGSQDYKDQEAMAKLQEEVGTNIQRINYALDIQLRLLEKLSGQDYWQQSQIAVNRFKTDLEFIRGELDKLSLSTYQTYGAITVRNTIGLQGLSLDEIESILGRINTETEGLLDLNSENLDVITQLVEEARLLEEQVESLTDTINEQLTGIGRDEIVDSIVSAFEEGEIAAGRFSETFSEIMKKAALNLWRAEYLEEPMKEWYQAFADAKKQTEATINLIGGGEGLDWPVVPGGIYSGLGGIGSGIVIQIPGGEEITPEEYSELEDSLSGIVDNAKAEYELINEFFASMGDITQPEGLQGAIKGITEDTAGIIAGQLHGIRFNILEGLDLAQDRLSVLNQIQENTSYNKYLLDIKTKLEQNTASNQSYVF